MMKMKNAFIFLLALLCLLMPASACAQSDIEQTLAHASGGLDFQDWIDGPLTEGAGSALDNYIIHLNHARHDLDLSSYTSAALEILNRGEIKNPVSRQRCALAVVSCGEAAALPPAIADETIGELGVMSYVYGLHLLNNGVESTRWTEEALIAKLLDLQKPDGGWSVMGGFGDTDVTSMCLQALAGCEKTPDLDAGIERALDFLSGIQLENGGFTGMGLENSESAAQVIVALSSLGIDSAADERFIKNEKSPLDALREYRLSSGGYAHQAGETLENATATLQALQALSAYRQIGSAYYDFSVVGSEMPHTKESIPGWKLWAFGAIAAFAMLGSIWALTRRHGRMKQLAFVLIIACFLAAMVAYINIETKAAYYSAVEPDNPSGEVYLSIRCDTVEGLADDGSTPESGIILDRTPMPCSDGDTVFDILTNAIRKYELHMEYQGGTAQMAYINGINNLYEYNYGDLSGWVYTLNGEQLSVGCGSCPVKDGDEIIWHYTIKLGEDIK